MFDVHEELRKWKEELVAKLHKLCSKQELLGGDFETRRKLDDEIAVLTMKICIVDREYQMCGGDQDAN